MCKRVAGLALALLTAHHLMVLLHEWAHGAAAWRLGLKPSPFHIHYGDWTLLQADEDVDYDPLPASGTPWRASLIAGAALVVNVLLYAASLRLMARVKPRPLAAQFAFWLAAFNLAELYSYMPLRAFSPGGDVGHVNAGLRLPPWVLFVLATPLIAWQIVRLLRGPLPSLWSTLGVNAGAPRIAYGALVVAIIFGLYGAAPIFYYGAADPRSRWSFLSLALGLAMFIGLRHTWVGRPAPEA
jgi:hypothetical protein